MKNLEEKLEIMQWLYSWGLAPEIYYDTDETHGRNFVNRDYAKSELSNLIKLRQIKPWYPLEQALALLPLAIDGYFLTVGQYDTDEYCIHYVKTSIATRLDDLYREDDSIMHERLITPQGRGPDYHLAALRALQEYLKLTPRSSQPSMQ